jgi:hypothetical protein
MRERADADRTFELDDAPTLSRGPGIKIKELLVKINGAFRIVSDPSFVHPPPQESEVVFSRIMMNFENYCRSKV